ncbi:MAG: phosphoribosyltransferase [Bacteroidetes bacterium]|nr:phosphoribosyltransferase [Bacteroidota bacterium]
MIPRFRDRKDAAQKLIPYLNKYRDQKVVILAIPRGGIPIAHPIAKTYNFPLDLLMTKKIGHPFQPEFAIGAVSPEDYIIDDQFSVDQTYIDSEVKRIRESLKERYKKCMGDHKPVGLENKVVIIIDDGVATGHTILSAIKMLRQKKPKKIVVAVPVAPGETAEKIKREVDDFICLYTPTPFIGVGLHYLDFSPVYDDEAIHLVKDANHFEENHINNNYGIFSK